MSLGIVDEDGPWVADVIYIYDEAFNIYWMSQPTRRHSQAIDGGKQDVAATITVTQGPDQSDEGLQISGKAQRVSSPSTDLLKMWMKKKKRPWTSALGAVMTNHVWYKIVPDRIELIHEVAFGRDRQKVL